MSQIRKAPAWVRYLVLPGGAFVALMGAYIAGSATLGRASAQSPIPQSQASITTDQVRVAALARFPGATITGTALENDDGPLVYSVRLTDTAGVRHEVKVDAHTGSVRGVEADDGENPDAADTGDGDGETAD